MGPGRLIGGSCFRQARTVAGSEPEEGKGVRDIRAGCGEESVMQDLSKVGGERTFSETEEPSPGEGIMSFALNVFNFPLKASFMGAPGWLGQWNMWLLVSGFSSSPTLGVEMT